MNTTTNASNVRRGALAVLALGAGLAVLTACTGGGAGHPATRSTAPATHTATSTAPTGGATTPTTPTTTVNPGPAYAPITVAPDSAAATTFGAANAVRGVEAAYHVVEVAAGLDQALAPGTKTAKTYWALKNLMTPQLWGIVSKAADQGDPDNNVGTLVITANSDGAIDVSESGTVMRHPRLVSMTPGPWTADVDRAVAGETRLFVSTNADLTFRGTVGGKAATVMLQRSYNLDLVPSGATSWLLDAYNTDTRPVAK